ncbi:MAG TPA: hypothetical protein PLA50_00715 [Bacteroidia bacterium]|nr:hypothetical protein [Bacteroidia bacterium]
MQTAAGLLCWLAITCCQMIRADEDQPAVDRPAQEAEKKDWNVVSIDGLGHVSVKNIETFYQFHSLKEEGDDWTLRHPMVILKGRVGSREIRINGIIYHLSFPVVRHEGETMLATFDLAKLIDPAIRPSKVKKPVEVQRVVVDPVPSPTEANGQADHTLALAERVKAALTEQGFEVGDQDEQSIQISITFSLRDEVTEAGLSTWTLALHGTPSTGVAAEEAESTERLPGNARDAENIALATAIHSYLVSGLEDGKPNFDRGIGRSRAECLRDLTVPGVHLEFAFPSKEGSESYDENALFDAISKHIAEGVVRYREATGMASE